MRCWSRKGKGWKAKAKVEVKEKVKVGGWRLEAEGKISNVKAQMPNGKIQMEKSLGKRKNEL